MRERNRFGKKRLFVACLCIVLIFFVLITYCKFEYDQNHIWEKEYQNGVEVMEYKLSIYMDDPYMQDEYDQYMLSQRKATLIGFMEELDRFVEICIKNHSESMGSEEDIYREAACILADNYEWRYLGNYEYFINYEEDVAGEWNVLCAAIEEKGKPIDEKIDLLYEEFGDDVSVYWRMSDAWETEFYHCVSVIKEDLEQSDMADKKQLMKALDAFENFIGKWAEYNEDFAEQGAYTASGRTVVAIARAQAFRTGTGILLVHYESAGDQYEFIYDYEKDRQEYSETME